MHFRTEPVELLKTQDQRPPFVGIDTIRFAVHHDRFIDMHALHPDLDHTVRAAQRGVILRQAMHRLDHGLKLHRAFADARARTVSDAIGVNPDTPNLSCSVR